MTISDKCDKIIKGLEGKYILVGLKCLYDEKPRYLLGTSGVYIAKKSCGVESDPYIFMSVYDYLDRVL